MLNAHRLAEIRIRRHFTRRGTFSLKRAVMKSWQRIIRGLGLATVLVFFTIVLTPLSNVLGRAMAIRPGVESTGAIVVLAAGMFRGGELNDESMRRCMKGIELYKKGFAPLLVLSGKGRPEQTTPTEAEVRAQLAQVAGVPLAAIIKEETANTTREESLLIFEFLKQRNVDRIMLVTESLHMRRAKMVFERAGLQVLAAPSDNLPNAALSADDRLWLSMRVAMESVAIIYYRVAGYL
jgi:uncharacterized SAM-binding protein YcdF (DUF218 family)